MKINSACRQLYTVSENPMTGSFLRVISKPGHRQNHPLSVQEQQRHAAWKTDHGGVSAGWDGRHKATEHDCVAWGVRRNHILGIKLIVSCALGGHNMQTQFMKILKVTLKLDFFFFLSNSLGHPEVKDNQSWKQMGYIERAAALQLVKEAMDKAKLIRLKSRNTAKSKRACGRPQL